MKEVQLAFDETGTAGLLRLKGAGDCISVHQLP